MNTKILTFILLFFAHCGDVQADHAFKKKKHKKPKVTTVYDYQLAVAAMFCDEAPYMKEWIEYYKLIGVEHFYLYNNGSKDNYREVLAPYINSHEVDLIEWPHACRNVNEFVQLQITVYRDALSLAKGRAKWLAVIDLDEFIVPVQEDNLGNYLRKFESSNLGGVCLIWSFFGTSNVKEIPADKAMIETLVCHSGPAAGGQVQQIWHQGAYKSIVQPAHVSVLCSPHYCQYVSGKRHDMLNYGEIRINHYWTRDEKFFEQVKIPRRGEWGQSSDSTRGCAAGMNSLTENNPILRFVPRLRERLF